MNRRPPRNFVAEPFEYHQEIELTIDTLTNLGHGLGRLDGWVVMVPFTIPGERVSARVYRNHKNYSQADLVQVLQPSSQRIEPRCPLFGECGGCQYQHMQYSAQAEWKRKQVTELLQNLSGQKLLWSLFTIHPNNFIIAPKLLHITKSLAMARCPQSVFFTMGNETGL